MRMKKFENMEAQIKKQNEIDYERNKMDRR